MASVTYKIGGQYDGKALKSAKKDLSDLANVVKGLAIIKAGQQLVKIANATKSVFVEQNKALTSFNTAVSKSGIELSRLNNLKKELSHGNFIDDDSLNNAMKLGIQMGLNAEQLEKVTKTAVNMASAGVKPLDKAMKELTKTAMTNESEFDAISQRYEGFADAMSNTFSGRNAQWQNSISDLKASIGAIPKSLEFLTQGKLLKPLNDITDWMVKNRNAIINFFLHLPEVFKTIGVELTSMLKRTFKNLPEWISNVGVYFVQIFKDGFSTLFQVAKETFNGMMTLLDFAIGNPFRSSKNFINTMLNNLIEGINGLADKLPKWAKKLIGADDGSAIDFRFSTGQNDLNKSWNETAQKIEKSMTNIIKAYSDGAKKTKDDWLKILDASTEFYKEDINELKEKLSKILGKELPKELQSALDAKISGEYSNSSTTLTSEQNKTGSAIATIGTTALSGIGDIGDIVQSVLSNGLRGAIATILAKILAKIQEVSPLFQWFQNVFNELLDILINPESGLIKAINDAIQPFIDGFNSAKMIFSSILSVLTSIINSFTPILEGLTMILNKIAPMVSAILELFSLLINIIAIVGDMLNPILEIILDVIAPVLEVIRKVIEVIYFIIATVVNVCIAIYNALVWRNKKDYISTQLPASTTSSNDYSVDLSGYATASATTTSGSASYQAVRDIYLSISFDHSFVNGDGREMALLIRDEIRSAERLGY